MKLVTFCNVLALPHVTYTYFLDSPSAKFNPDKFSLEANFFRNIFHVLYNCPKFDFLQFQLQMTANKLSVASDERLKLQTKCDILAMDGEIKLKFLMEHRIPFILHCFYAPNNVRPVNNKTTCFTLAPPTPRILNLAEKPKYKRQNDGNENGAICALLYAGFANFMRVYRDRKNYDQCYTAPLQRNNTDDNRNDEYRKEIIGKDEMCFLFEFIPFVDQQQTQTNDPFVVIRSRANGKFLYYSSERHAAEYIEELNETVVLDNIRPEAESIDCATKFFIDPVTILNGDAIGVLTQAEIMDICQRLPRKL